MSRLIKALQEQMEFDVTAYGLFVMEFAAKVGRPPTHKELFQLAHEAATARLLPLIEKAVEMAEDMDKHGLRFDLNPTQPMCDWMEVTRFYLDYIKRMDNSVKEKAREFLTTLADASGESGKGE